MIPYWIAQYLGAFLAAVVVYGVYVGMRISLLMCLPKFMYFVLCL